MVAGVITFQLLPGKTAELLQIATNAVLPLMQQQAGCQLITLLTDRSANKVLTVGLWESITALQANEQCDLVQEQLSKLHDLCTTPPLHEMYEVSFQTAPI